MRVGYQGNNMGNAVGVYECKATGRGGKKIRIMQRCLMAVLLLGLVVGCTSKEKAKQIKFQEVSVTLEEKFMDTIMVEMNDSDFLAMFDLDPSQVVQSYYKFAFLDIRADEIVMIQLRDENLVSDAEQVLWNRVQALRDEFDGYIEEQKSLVDRAIVFHEGKYLFLIIGEHASDIQDHIINSFS